MLFQWVMFLLQEQMELEDALSQAIERTGGAALLAGPLPWPALGRRLAETAAKLCA